MIREPFSNPSDFENPYQPPESEGKLTTDTIIAAMPMKTLLLTTFGGGVIVVAFLAGAVIVFGSINDLRRAPAFFIPTYTYWTAFPGLISGLIARQISLGRSTNRELILVASVMLVPALIVIGYAKGAGAAALPLHVFTIISLGFQFWLASKIGKLCCGRELHEDAI